MAKVASSYKRRLVIFAKAPVLGTVKSRLAAGVGFVEATRWYRSNCKRLVRRLAADERWQTFLAVTPDDAVKFEAWVDVFPVDVPRLAQGSGSLGDRMARVLNNVGPGPVAIVGSDIPAIGSHHIERAFRALGEADMVFGPSSDGGYWLIGKSGGASPPISLANVRWSTEHTLRDTLAIVGRRRVAMLETLNDVDEASDLN